MTRICPTIFSLVDRTGHSRRYGAGQRDAVNFVGELGWELHHPIEYQNHIFDALFDAGEDFGLKPFGIRAMDSMRLEKSYRMVGTEMSIEYSAYESTMDRFVHPDKGDFLGRKALLASKHSGPSSLLVTLDVAEVDDADALGNNALYDKGQLSGGRPVADTVFGYANHWPSRWFKPELAKPGVELDIEILGKAYKAMVVPDSPFDPKNKRLRGALCELSPSVIRRRGYEIAANLARLITT